MTRSPLRLTLFALAGSFALHGAAYAALPRRAALVSSDAPPPVTIEVAPARPRSEPVPEPAPPKPAPPEPEPARARPRPAAPVAAPPEPPPDRAPAPLDLRGVTLTNDGAGDFATAVGDGSRLAGPLRAPAPKPVPVESAPAPRAAPKPVAAVVPASDLSERPEPPSLDAALRRNYPPDAERLGIGGSASVRARIEPDGRVGALSVLGESHPGFGEACRRTLRGSRWSPPRDRAGRPVATEIRYTCRFVVSR